MLTIRQLQLERFETVALQAFEDRTYLHLLRYFPRHCALVGEPQMRRAVRFGLQKSRSYGFTAECCVRSYIDLMCLLGAGFDADPLLPWAGDILRDKTDANQVARGDRLYDRAWQYIEHIIPDYRNAEREPVTARFVVDLRKLRHESDEMVASDQWQPFARALVDRLRDAFPAKSEYVGVDAMRGLAASARDLAGRHGIRGARGITVCAAMKFVLGDGFDRDMLLPWASAVLNDRHVMEESQKVDRLFAGGIDFLRRWWATGAPAV